ncbi:integral membrane sensor signal transduction histidine kinase [Methylocella silvestris BL2]|uniref:histidine kinase n=1 Tax=Methylocella silvestris (strain DSM 15510 / CIP 108128 / LMG 27833 / NCIMB 13906 / BL2) TaxID=395965 RepID=B8EN36_METSB|nr:ATP-binding protein [Methylocella silvestris]ACK49171.1 integral membrane sensor signal transduction histidine kinase [Methylocella silvestris BL2]
MTALAKLFRTTVFKVSLAFLVISAIGAGLVLSSVGDNVKMLIDQQIANTVDADIAGLAEQYAQGGIRRLVQSVENRTQRPGADLYLVTTGAGEPLVGNIASLPPGVLERPGLVETTYEPAGAVGKKRRALARIFVLPAGFRLVVGHDLEEGESLRNILRGALLTSLIWLVAIGTLGGLWVARRVLNRVDAINARAKTIVAGDLTGRLPIAGTGDELDRLVQNLNAMLDRISLLMTGLKQVSDNIAHDLKTPLTRLRARAEAALQFGKTPEDYRGALEKVLEESDRLIQIFDALLKIARAEAGSGPEGAIDFDAGAMIADVGELYEPAVEELGLGLDVQTQPNLIIHGSRELVGQAIANLVDNALKYGAEPAETGAADSPAQKNIELLARRAGAVVEIVVGDHGPGIPPADRERVLDRFVRLENSRSRPGSGLGLSLAAAVARLHNGTLRLEDNAPGLRVVIALPAAAITPKNESAPKLSLPPPEAAA